MSMPLEGETITKTFDHDGAGGGAGADEARPAFRAEGAAWP
ncbi:hypothetical protein [Sorangium sp. So ce854]